MSARILIIALCGVVAIGGVGAALADDGDEQIGSLDPVDLRKDDSLGDAELVDDEPNDDPTGDGDKTRGDDGTGGGDNTDRDKTRGDDGTSWGHNNDHDSTAGHDGTGGGDNSEYAAPAAAPAPAPVPAPAPAPARVYDDYSDDGGAVYSSS